MLICRGWQDSIAVVTRFLNQIAVLRHLEGIELHVAWLLDWNYRYDPACKRWVDDIRRDWDFPSILLYSLPPFRFREVGRILSGVYRLAVLTGYVLRHRISVVCVHTFSGVPGALLGLKALLGIRCVLDLQAAVPEELDYHGKGIAVVRRANARERAVLERCDSVFCVSQALVEHVVEKHKVARDKFHVVPCCVPKTLVGRDPECRNHLREVLGIKSGIALVYSGGTDRYQCIDEMCALVSRIFTRCREAVWLIFTWGDIELFRRHMARYGVDESRCRFECLPQRQVHEYLTAADIGLLLREDHVLNRVSSPTKFAEYMAAGVPVITTPFVGDVSEAVEHENIGLLVSLPPETDEESVTVFLEQVKRNREAFAERCIDYVNREWIWESYAPEFRQAVCGDAVHLLDQDEHRPSRARESDL